MTKIVIKTNVCMKTIDSNGLLIVQIEKNKKYYIFLCFKIN